MLGLVSVQTDLAEIKLHLESAGYHIVDMADAGVGIEAVVYTGEPCVRPQRSLRSAEDCFTVMVNAAGLSPEQVAEELSLRLGSRNIQELS